MSEDRPKERRVGDATQARIKDMADGWKTPDPDAKAAKTPPRPKPTSAPPPPPPPKGTPAATPAAKPPAAKPPAAVPPAPVPPAPTAKPRTTANTVPRAKRKSSGPPKPPPGASKPPGPPKSSVSGELDSGQLPVPPPVPSGLPPLPKSAPARRSKPTSVPPPPPATAATTIPATPKAKAEGSPLPKPAPIAATRPDSARDDDETVVPTGDEPELPELRAPAALPRRKGLLGDILYVGTVLFGRRSIRTELIETEQEIEAEKRSRDKELTELARLVIADPDISTPDVERARETLVDLEEARSRKAGAAAAAEQAIGNILRERDKVKEAREKEVAELEATMAELEAEIEPLEKRRVEIGKRARELADRLTEFDARIAAEVEKTESGQLEEAAAAEAALAGLRAEREAVAANEPLIASELAEVDPSIRELKKKKNELGKKKNKLRRAEDESVVRSAEKVTAARAHKTVVDRAAADRTRDQNELLRDLGDTLWRKPPPSVASLAVPLEERAMNLERLKERAVRCREKLASVETGPLLRGAAVWLLVFAIIGVIVYFAAIK